jgi:single-stranded DNA-binding protein
MLDFTIGVKTNKANESMWVDVRAFDLVAESAFPRLVKGVEVIIDGRLDIGSFQTDAGEKRSKTRIIANTINVFQDAPVRAQNAPTRPEQDEMSIFDTPDTPAPAAKALPAQQEVIPF